jgi:hypothetical protein
MTRVRAAVLAVPFLLACCGSGTASQAKREHWHRFRHLAGVLDLTAQRKDGRLTVAAAGRLSLLRTNGSTSPFARGSAGYSTAAGAEAYIALAAKRRVPGAGCSFTRDDVFALDPGSRPGVVRVDTGGRAHRFAELPNGSFPNGIAFDTVGRFGFGLLVTAAVGKTTTVVALDCRGRTSTVAQGAPRSEGGIAVAPSSFGAFGGQLIAPDEHSGRILAIAADGSSRTVASSGLSGGPDIGVESAGFVPAGLRRSDAAYLADRGTPGNPHPGTDTVLRLSGAALKRAGVRAGDLLLATEASARTIAVHCSTSCTVKRIADGPTVAHAEGHIVFAPGR